MKTCSDEDMDDQFLKIIGLGQRSIQKSYYPQLQKRLQELNEKNAHLVKEIEERKNSEEELEKSEERYLLLCMRTGRLVYDCNVSSGEISWSGAIEEISGFIPGEFQCTHLSEWAERVHEDHRAHALGIFDRAIQNASTYKMNYLFKRKDETFIYVEDCGAFLANKEGKAYRALGSLKDISESKRAEQEREKLKAQLTQFQKMESIGNLAAGIAHDFNNILSPIIGMSELLLEDLAPHSSEHENAQEILNAGVRGSELVKQILTFGRKTERKMRPVQFGKIVDEVLKLVRSSISADIEISQDIQPDFCLVMADQTQVHQIVMNLITNACHAVESTDGKIHVQLEETEKAGNGFPGSGSIPARYAELSISDTGCGIPSELMDKIFDPYFTTKEQGKGTGLGLSVVDGIVKEHRGNITVCSKAGSGTTFCVYLPLIESSIQVESAKKVETYPTGDERILLVDDEVAIVDVKKQMLERLGYRVTASTSSLEILETFRLNPQAFDLVLTVMNMPHMNGDQLAWELVAIRPDIRIVLCTGFNEMINEKKIEETVIKRFLMKPVGMSDLANTLRKLLDEPNATN